MQLNNFFLEYYSYPQIMKVITFGTHISELFCIPLTSYIDHRFSLYIIIKLFGVLIVLLFNVIYWVSVYLPVSNLKIGIFFILLLLISGIV